MLVRTKVLCCLQICLRLSVIDSHQARRSSDTAMRTSSSLVGDMELVTMLASSREPGADRFRTPTSTGAFPPPGAGGTASSPPPAAGSLVRGKRALASPGDPADTETMLTAGPAWSSSPALWAHRVLPSTPMPGSPAQPSSSHPSLSTQPGVSSATLHSEDATGNSASPALTALPASENTSRAAGSSYQPSNSSAAEKRIWGFHTTSTSMSTTATRGAGRTLRSLPASTRLAHAAEISTSGTETISSPDQTRSPGPSVGAEAGGGTDAIVPSTAPQLARSSSASDSAATSFHSSHGPKSIPVTGEAMLHSEVSPALTSVVVGTPGSPSSSATSTDPTSSLGQTLSSSVTKAHQTDGWQGDTDLTEHPQELSSLLSASAHVFTGIRSSRQPTDTSTAEKETSASSTTSAYVSATATGSGGRPPRSVTNSSHWATEVSAPSSDVSRTSGTIRSSPASSVRATYGVHGARETTGFSQPVEDPLLLRSHSPAEGPTATGSSLPSFSILTTEERTDFDATSSSMSTTATRGAGRTLRSLPASTRLAHAAEISTSGTETISSPDQTRSPGPSVGAEAGGGTDAIVPSTAPQLARSSSASGSAATAEGAITSSRGRSLPDTPLTSTPSSVTATSDGERTVEPVVDTSTGNSAPASASTSSLDIVLLLSSVTEPRRQRDISQTNAGLVELPTKPLPVFPPGVSVPSSSPSASVPERGQWVSGVPTETTYVLTVLSTRGEGTSRDEANRSTWSMEMESPTSHPGTAGEPHSGPLPSFPAWSGGEHVSSDYAGYTEPKVTLSSRVSTYFSASGEPSTVGSSHRSPSSLSTEEEISSSYTDASHRSATLAGGEGTRVTSSDMAHSTESSASYTETASLSEPIWPASADQSRTVNASAGSTGFATETLFTHSSEIATDPSFQNDLTSFSSSHQPVSSLDAEKRTSVSHTDGTYISTTYTRGGERTLLSISNSSTSADSSESSTFFSEISNPADSSKSSVAQDRRSNASSNGSFVEPSTEPLLVHSSQPLTSASVGNTQNTTLFDTDSEVLPTGRSSLSSSAFPPSSSASPLHHSLTSTPPPTYLLATSEPSEMLSSSVMASSAPLQALSSSLSTSSLLSSSYSLPSLLPLFSSPSSVSQSDDSSRISTPLATTAVRRVPSTAAVAGSSPRETSKHGGTRQPPNTTTFTPTTSPPLPTTPMELLGGRIASTPAPTVVTENTSPRAATSQGGTAGKAPPLLTTASEAPRAVLTDAPLSTSPSATSHGAVVPAVPLTTVKPLVLTTPASRRPTPTDASTTKPHRTQTPAATKHVYTPGERTEATDLTTSIPSKVTKENIPATSPPEIPPTIKTTVSVRTTLAATKRTTIPPPSSTAGVRTSPATDVDKCLSNPCPALATCNNTQGSYVCQCPLGYELEKGKCNLVRIFIGQVPLKPNVTHGKYADLKQLEGEILAMLDASLSGLPGYHHSTVKATRETNFVHVSVQSTFSLASNVTFYDIVGSVQSYIRACKSPTDSCQFISSLKPLHRVGSLCKQKDPECDKETSECTDFDGVALCQCKSGYFKYNKMDHSCRACEDGYKLENETCVSCPFGLGGFNCGNPYQLITVVIAAAGGGLLLIMGIALIVTCCRKNKNDISKLIFKSGDFQMSPYAEYPKNPRAQEWGRETIEMQENGSTKNLLQMTDVYYSPTGLRNPELERNGLYPPYTGLPGSRHSCIYPGQYNPSFISDETRRRDYF
ncbi:protein HEG homolog 1 isoform X2 [Anas platyrhynchos]|uniref:protein HEG homolog 1 isoform X2 n=1 Tax=Anas platyrhynchos TaxID=8839 RepID=UPI003AF30BDC